MKRIKCLAKRIDAELSDASTYAEMYIDSKTSGNQQRALEYKEMASDELEHAGELHEMAVQDIQATRKYIEPPSEMLERWDAMHRDYVERATLVKATLEL